MSNNEPLYLIDATAFCYRAFYAIRSLSSSSGQPTNAIYGFVVMLNKILKIHKPQLLGVCFDVSRDTFRQKKFADYKIQRPPMPDGLKNQIPLIRQVISAYGIPILEKEGFEADDIIATISKKASLHGIKTVVVSSDKDMLQLVEESVSVFSPYKDDKALAQSIFKKANLSYQKGDCAQALKLAVDAMQLDPSNTEIEEFINKLQVRLLSK